MRARSHRRRSSDAPAAVPPSPTSSQSHPQSHAHSQSSHGHPRPSPAAAYANVPAAPQAQDNPFDTPVGTPVSPDHERGAPPSAFPFLSHAGNPDPGTPLPVGGTIARRPSHESFRRAAQMQSQNQMQTQGASQSQNQAAYGYAQHQAQTPTTPGYPVTPGAQAAGYSAVRGSMDVTTEEDVALGRPYAPFMGEGADQRQSWVSNSPVVGAGANSVYRNSAAAALTGSSSALAGGGAYSTPLTICGARTDNGLRLAESPIPRTSSQPQIAMRAPFLSPASRPSSSVWSPPSYPSLPMPATPGQPLTSQYPPSLTYLTGSSSNPYLVPRKAKPPMPPRGSRRSSPRRTSRG